MLNLESQKRSSLLKNILQSLQERKSLTAQGNSLEEGDVSKASNTSEYDI